LLCCAAGKQVAIVAQGCGPDSARVRPGRRTGGAADRRPQGT
jgi:hypothetical protein